MDQDIINTINMRNISSIINIVNIMNILNITNISTMINVGPQAFLIVERGSNRHAVLDLQEGVGHATADDHLVHLLWYSLGVCGSEGMGRGMGPSDKSEADSQMPCSVSWAGLKSSDLHGCQPFGFSMAGAAAQLCPTYS